MRAPVTPDASSKPAWERFGRPSGQLVVHRADLWNLKTSHTSLREELTKQLPLKDRRKTGKNPQTHSKTKIEPLLKYQH
jgi:hypothetical protein